MKSRAKSDLKTAERSLSEKVKRAVHPAQKKAPATEELRGWAKSRIKERNKS